MSPRVVLTPACVPGRGGGHVVRCLALARASESLGATCSFVLEEPGVALLRRLGWNGQTVAADGAGARVAAIRALQPDAAVVDDYDLGAAFEAALGTPVLAIDDLADRAHACVLLLDSAYGRIAADYATLAPGARPLLGSDYALLRKGFAGPVRAAPATVGRVFVCFGLSDVDAIAARAVRLLRPRAPTAVFDVALASEAASLPTLEVLAAADPGLVLHRDADVAPLMRTADLAVGAGGGMLWERRAANLPQLVIVLADNQRPMAKRLEAEDVIAMVDLADPAFEHRLAGSFDRLLPRDARQAQLDNPRASCDGLGAERAAKALLESVG